MGVWGNDEVGGQTGCVINIGVKNYRKCGEIEILVRYVINMSVKKLGFTQKVYGNMKK